MKKAGGLTAQKTVSFFKYQEVKNHNNNDDNDDDDDDNNNNNENRNPKTCDSGVSLPDTFGVPRPLTLALIMSLRLSLSLQLASRSIEEATL